LRKVHTADSMVELAHLRNVLETAGIPCHVRNERLGGALGEIPFVECWPELWVLRNGDALRARGLIDVARSRPAEPLPSWICERCGERVEGEFDACWRCAGEQLVPGAAPP
jgi:Putative prokaryotic signal transducing protein